MSGLDREKEESNGSHSAIIRDAAATDCSIKAGIADAQLLTGGGTPEDLERRASGGRALFSPRRDACSSLSPTEEETNPSCLCFF
jgi:hypothetical protein